MGSAASSPDAPGGRPGPPDVFSGVASAPDAPGQDDEVSTDLLILIKMSKSNNCLKSLRYGDREKLCSHRAESG